MELGQALNSILLKQGPKTEDSKYISSFLELINFLFIYIRAEGTRLHVQSNILHYY